MSIPDKAFYMIRHGETEANAARIMAGSIDTPLTEHGKIQADIARQVIEKITIKPAAIFHSHLSRARDTASIINKNGDIKNLDIMSKTDLAKIIIEELTSLFENKL